MMMPETRRKGGISEEAGSLWQREGIGRNPYRGDAACHGVPTQPGGQCADDERPGRNGHPCQTVD